MQSNFVEIFSMNTSQKEFCVKHLSFIRVTENMTFLFSLLGKLLSTSQCFLVYSTEGEGKKIKRLILLWVTSQYLPILGMAIKPFSGWLIRLYPFQKHARRT